MRKFIFLILLFVAIIPSYGIEVEVDTIYYDKDWKGVSNRHFADYYRIIESDPAPGYPKRFRDFYITGEIQGQGIYESIDRLDDSNTIFGDGEFIWYYKNGQISKQHKMKNGVPDGEYLTFYENGNPHIKGHFLSGKPNGEYLVFYENGNPQIEGSYKDGNQDGEFYEYDEDGTARRLVTYKNGILHGTLVILRDDGCYVTDEYINGEPAYDWYVITNDDGLYMKYNRKTKDIEYHSPSISEKRVQRDDDNTNWVYYNNDGVTVATSCKKTNDYGKYHRVYVVITNNTFKPMVFNPSLTTAILTDEKGKDIALEIQTANDYKNRINRTHMWEEGFSGLAEGLSANSNSYSKSTTTTVRSNGSASVSRTKTYDATAAAINNAAANQRMADLKQSNANLRQSKIENYVHKVTIQPGQTYRGYFNVKRKKTGSMNLVINVGGAEYRFPWSVTK